jgi:hypothetical protein
MEGRKAVCIGKHVLFFGEASRIGRDIAQACRCTLRTDSPGRWIVRFRLRASTEAALPFRFSWRLLLGRSRAIGARWKLSSV